MPIDVSILASIRRDNRDLAVIGFVSGGHFLAHFYALAFPPLFSLLVDEFSLSNTQLGLLMSVMALATFVLQIPVGLLVDRTGAKRVFVAGVLLVGAGTMLAGVGDSYAFLLVAAFIIGIGQSAFHPADFALLDAATTGGDEGTSFAFHTFAGYAGFAVAPFLVGGLGLAVGWRPALLAVGAAGVLYAAASQLAMRPLYRNRMDQLSASSDVDSPVDPPSAGLLSSPILLLFAFFVVVTMANKGIHTFTGVFLIDGFGLGGLVGNAALTSYFTLTAIGVLVGGGLADRFEANRILGAVLVIAGLAVGVTVSGAFPVTSTTAVAMFGVVGLFYGLALPSRDRLINQSSSDATTGQSFGFVYTGLPLGAMLSPVLLGAVIDVWSTRPAFGLIALFFVASSAIGFVSGVDLLSREDTARRVEKAD